MTAIQSTQFRFAFYGRMSTIEQEHSIDAQALAAEQFCAAGGHSIVEQYIDRGIAGDLTTDKRPDFQRMLRDGLTGKFDAVLVRDPARLTRSNSIKGSAELVPLYDAGITIVTSTGLVMDLSTMAGRIQLQMWFEMSHADNRSRGLNVASGMFRCAKNSSWIGGRPLGYKITGEKGEKRLIVGDAHEVDVVRRVYRLYDNGSTIEQIAKGLESDGILTMKGNAKWDRTTIAGILKNPVYAGDFAFGKNVYGRYYRVSQEGVVDGGNRRKNDASEWTVNRDVYPAIIERKQWDRVQKRVQANKGFANNNGSFLLSSRLRCAKCDEPMHGRTMRSGNRQYECIGCGATVNEQIAVREIIKAISFDTNSVETAMRKQLMPASPNVDQQKRKRLEREIAKQKRKLVMCDDDAELVVELKADIARLRGELDLLDDQCRSASIRFDLEQLIRLAVSKLADLPTAIEKADHAATRRFLMEAVSSVRLATTTTGQKRKRYHLAGGDIELSVNNTVNGMSQNPHPPG